MKEAKKTVPEIICDKNAAIVNIFCCKDKDRVKPVIETMRKKGFPVWYPPADNSKTREWKIQLSVRLDKAYAVILFITENVFKESDPYLFTQYDEAREIGKVIIPVYMDDVDIQSVKTEYKGYIAQWNKLQGVTYRENRSSDELSEVISKIIDNSSQIKYSSLDDTSKYIQKTETGEYDSTFFQKPKRNKKLFTAAVIEYTVVFIALYVLMSSFIGDIRRVYYNNTASGGAERIEYVIWNILLLVSIIIKFNLCRILYLRSEIKDPPKSLNVTAKNSTDKELNNNRNKKTVAKIFELGLLFISIIIIGFASYHISKRNYLFDISDIIDFYYFSFEALEILFVIDLILSPIVLWFVLYGKSIKAAINKFKTRKKADNA